MNINEIFVLFSTVAGVALTIFKIFSMWQEMKHRQVQIEIDKLKLNEQLQIKDKNKLPQVFE